jgi:hypothetical protein
MALSDDEAETWAREHAADASTRLRYIAIAACYLSGMDSNVEKLKEIVARLRPASSLSRK